MKPITKGMLFLLKQLKFFEGQLHVKVFINSVVKVSELAEKVKRYESQKKFLHELVFLVDQIQGGN